MASATGPCRRRRARRPLARFPDAPSTLPCCGSRSRTHPRTSRSATRHATMKSLSLRCGAPTSEARTHVQTASYPLWESSPRTSPSPRAARAATFSTTTIRGASSRTIRANSNHRPLRAPARPAPLPAVETSWQGNPPQRMSTGAAVSLPRDRTSSCRTASGQCRARTRRHHSCCSHCHVVSASNPPSRRALSRPSSSPPIPAKSDPIVTRGLTTRLRARWST